jgi:hypothetical protein
MVRALFDKQIPEHQQDCDNFLDIFDPYEVLKSM